MEAPKPFTPGNELNEIKEYELKINNDTFKLTLEYSLEERIFIQIRQTNNLSFYLYKNDYNYEEITKSLSLLKDHYDNISKVIKFIDTAMTKNKFKLRLNEKTKKMELYLKRVLDFDEIECFLYLEEQKITNEEMLKILFDEIKEIKTKGIPHNLNKNEDNNALKLNQDNIKNIKDLEEKMEGIINNNNTLKEEIKSLKEENKKLKELVDKHENFIEKKIDKEKKAKEEEDKFIKNNIQSEFKDDPKYLKLSDTLTKKNKTGNGNLYNFDVFIGLKDHIEYLIYANEESNLDIMRIRDKTIITSLKGHNGTIYVIKYYQKENKEEYILSSDEKSLVIIWDIQNYYSKKYSIQSTNGRLFDALLLFNVFNKDYILLPSYETNNFSKLYEFTENTPFIKNIYGTNENNCMCAVPWFYNNKYYIIQSSDDFIIINNLFENENYAKLSMGKSPNQYYCCLYKKNYLCVTSSMANNVRIWDLVNKVIYKQIDYEAKYDNGYEIVHWNDKYSIVGTHTQIVIMDIEKGEKVIKVVEGKNIVGIKKIKLNNLGECLITSGNENISLFHL